MSSSDATATAKLAAQVGKDSKEKQSTMTSGYSIYGVIHLAAFLFAIYLSFKCNKGFDLGAFVMALIFPYLYIIYKFATDSTFCGLREAAKAV